MEHPSEQKARLLRALCLATFWGFAVAQPLYAVLASEGSFFLGKQLLPLEAWLTLFLLSFILPMGIIGLVEIARPLHPRYGERVYRLFIWGWPRCFSCPC